MFRINEFNLIYELIEKKQKINSQKKLGIYRKAYGLHPDYLFLMSKYLILDKRYYQSIDTLLASLKINSDEMLLIKNNFEASHEKVTLLKFKLISYLFKLIDNNELSFEADTIKNFNDQKKFLKKLSVLMPGVKFKKN